MAKLSEFLKTLPRRSVALEVGGATYQMRLDVNGLIAAQAVLGVSLAELQEVLKGGVAGDSRGLEVVRAILWASLREADPDLTVFDVGPLIETIGMEKAVQAMGEAVTASFPESDGEENPPKAA